MNSLRSLTNSVLGGLLAAVLLAQITLHVNPHLAGSTSTVIRLVWVLAAAYGVGGTLIWWSFLKLVEWIRGRSLRPAWFSFRVLTWIFMMDIAGGAVLYWHNLFVYRMYLPPESIRGLAIAAAVVSGCAAILLVIALFHYSFGRRGATLSYSFFSLAVAASVLVPFMLPTAAAERPRSARRIPLADTPTPRRITLVGIEGASLSYLLPAVAEGKLPNFARLIQGGASGPLQTLYPNESMAIWTSIATGKLPHQHRLAGFYRYRLRGIDAPLALLPRGPYMRGLERLGLSQRMGMGSAQRQSLPFWTIVNRFGVRTGTVRWWATYPAEEVDGFVVSDMFHRQARERREPPLPRLTFPTELYDELRGMVLSPAAIDPTQWSRFVDTSVELRDEPTDWEADLKRRGLADDTTYHLIGKRLRERFDPQVFGIYFFGLDIVGHYFLRYAEPENFGDVSELERRKFGGVFDGYYRYLDGLLAEYIEATGPGDTLMVISGHGIEAVPLSRRIVEALKGNSDLSGYHARAPDGLIILYGTGIAAGAKLQRASVLDITPTLLYLLGLPIGQDMDGSLLNGAFEASLARSQPVTFISSYQSVAIQPPGQDFDAALPLDLLPEAPHERQ